MKEIATALVKAQSEMSNAVKGSANPFFKSKYADLNSIREAVIPVLNAHNISVIQPMVNIDGHNFIKTVLLHVSGESIESFTEIIYAKTNDAQAQGSGITYARRYGLQSLVCIGADDDDGNKASEQPKKELPVSIDSAITEMGKAKSYTDIEATWKKFIQFQKEPTFIAKCVEMQKTYPNVKS